MTNFPNFDNEDQAMGDVLMKDIKIDKDVVSNTISRAFLEGRKIFLWGTVNDQICSRVTAQLLYFESINPGKEITLYLNTPGGSITAGMAVYDTIKLISSPVKVIVTGMAASMGAILISAAKKGNRYIFPHARLLIHQPLIMGRIEAPAVDINIHAQEMEKQRDELNQILADASGQPLAKIKKDTDRDFYMNAKEALEYGLADHIVNKL